MVIQGIGNIRKENEARRKANQKNWIRTLKLGDGDVATFRFLTDGEQLVSARYHSVKEMTTNGERFRKKICTGVGCPNCLEEAKSSEMWHLWIWVFYIDHARPNPNVGVEEGAVEWKKTKKGSAFVFREEINAPMVFRMGMGQKGVYRKDLESKFDDYGTFLDRNYRYARSGVKKDTSYSLNAQDPSEMPEEVKVAMETLPSLSKVVMGEIKSFDGDDSSHIDEEADGKPEEAANDDDGTPVEDMF